MDDRHTDSYLFLRENLGCMGMVSAIGSALTSDALIKGHDFDIKLRTSIRSKKFIIDQIEAVAKKWHRHELTPLHVFVTGFFEREVIQKNDLLIHFTSPIGSYVLWLKIVLQKYRLSLSKRLSGIIKRYMKKL
jgi:hypothetical protein